jgi:carbonic anhydrase/acetyltransferase-like protein (isoleucine patch superfamily)
MAHKPEKGNLTRLLEHQGKRPRVDESAYIAPTANICGDVTIGENGRILFGAVIVAEGGPVEIGAECIVMENAVIRGTRRHPVRIGDPRNFMRKCGRNDYRGVT